MQEWSEGFWGAVSIILCSALIVLWLQLTDVGRQATELVYADRAVTQEMKEYREISVYDTNGEYTLYAQDVVAAILEYRGTPAVRVKIGNKTTNWVPSTSSQYFKTTYISTKVPANYRYKCVVSYDNNGVPSRLTFTGKK